MARISCVIEGSIDLITALHIGSGMSGVDTDATVLRDSAGRPYLPGSSLRGALRSAIEANTLDALSCHGTAAEPGVCAGVGSSSLRSLLEAGTEKEIVERLTAPLDRSDPNKSGLCTTCLLFGTVYMASPLHIPDLYLTTASHRSEIRHGVGIDRDTGAARENIKYDFEVLSKGHRFTCLIRLDQPVWANKALFSKWLALLSMGLRLLELEEVRLGGRAARGLGRVKLALDRVTQSPLDGHELIYRLMGDNAAAGVQSWPQHGATISQWLRDNMSTLQATEG